MPSQFIKDPNATLDYTFDWSDYLEAGETITAGTVISNHSSLIVDSFTAGTVSVRAWISGGVVDSVYKVGCRVTTSESRIDERSITITCHER